MIVGDVSPNVKMANIIASLLYFPMLIFSGATLPYEIMPFTASKNNGYHAIDAGLKAAACNKADG